MRLLAAAKKSATGFTQHNISTINESGQPEKIVSIDHIAMLEIKVEDDGVYLFYLNGQGECLADTWHTCVAEAMEQARLEFSVEENDWEIAE